MMIAVSARAIFVFCLETITEQDGWPHCYCVEDVKIVNGEGRECYIDDHRISSNCSISGTFCDVESNTCYRSYDEPRVIYNPVGHDCVFHFDCGDGLYCSRNGCDQSGRCEECNFNYCPYKGNPNFPTCRRGEPGCPDV